MARVERGLAYVGLKGHVLALDRRTGEIVWSAKLKGMSFVYVQLDGDLLLATTSGEVFALDPKLGGVVWHNPLKGYGLGTASVAGEFSAASGLTGVEAEIQRQRQSRAGAPG